jgi:pimeloyl-ACP methyl ester carboxylesterase
VAIRPEAKTFVLVHGAWHGGWCWRDVARPLRAAGHTVFTPTQTGLGERRHLLSGAVGLEVFALDVAHLLEAEELTDVVLVGHSFGGLTITAVADRLPDRLRHLVYLDAGVVHSGSSVFSEYPADLVAARRAAAAASPGGLSMPPPPPAFFGIPDGPRAAWVARRMTPHPIATYEQPLALRNPVIGNGRPCTYVACVAPLYAPLEVYRQRVQGFIAAGLPWSWRELATGHDAMVLAPEALAEVLLTLA